MRNGLPVDSKCGTPILTSFVHELDKSPSALQETGVVKAYGTVHTPPLLSGLAAYPDYLCKRCESTIYPY